MRYIGRLLLYIIIFWLTFSISLVIALRFVPITVTPLKVLQLVENFPERGIALHSSWKPLDKISQSVVRAVVATEDNNFLFHSGFDWEAIDKALAENREGGRLRGGSTISQQVAKNVFCLPDRTWLRKGFEAYYTLLTEVAWTKYRIMEVYLNVIETGTNMFGVEAPAQRVYDKKAADLNLHEASMIATVLPSPRRMRLATPSSYMTRRAARVRSMMNMLPEIDFEDPKPVVKEKIR